MNVGLRALARYFGSALMRRPFGQRIIAAASGELDWCQGYGAGADLAASGEVAIFNALRRLAPTSGHRTVFDVGANKGDFTAAALEHLHDAPIAIHAFEPARSIHERFVQRFAGDARVVANNVALGKQAGDAALYSVDRDTGMSSLLQRNLKHLDMTPSFQETVQVVSLSGYCAERRISAIDLVKLDVEGYELEVLAGSVDLFERGAVRMCSFEFGGCNLDSRTYLRDFFEFFERYDMRIFRIAPTGVLTPLPAYRETWERFTTTNYVAAREDLTRR